MKEYLFHMALTILLASLKEVVQLPAIRKPMLKLFTEISSAYENDPEFQAAAKGNAASA